MSEQETFIIDSNSFITPYTMVVAQHSRSLDYSLCHRNKIYYNYIRKKVTVPNKTLIEKAKIPNIANHFGVKVADLFYMMRTLRFKL